LINSDSGIGSFNEVRKFVVIDLKTMERKDFSNMLL